MSQDSLPGRKAGVRLVVVPRNGVKLAHPFVCLALQGEVDRMAFRSWCPCCHTVAFKGTFIASNSLFLGARKKML